MARDDREWLETDGLGGFASGTVSGRRTRRYHAVLLTATHPPTGRFVLVNGFEAYVTTSDRTTPLSSQRYLPNAIHPDGDRYLESFEDDPWPTWTFRTPDGVRVRHECFMLQGSSATILRWSLVDATSGMVTLNVRPLLSGRDYHALHQENGEFDFHSRIDQHRVTWKPYEGVPPVRMLSNGQYTDGPVWYRQFRYTQEEARGLDFVEDCASPGMFRFQLSREPAVWVVTAVGEHGLDLPPHQQPGEWAEELAASERARRGKFPTRLHRSADQYLVKRGSGLTVIAGYPWFTDWGRDTFIALRGLCLATGRLAEAGRILSDWADTLSDGMLPNVFPDGEGEPAFNSVDASLWYVIAVHEYLEAMRAAGEAVSASDRQRFEATIEAILSGYDRGTRFGISCDIDGLLWAGTPGVQLTWMDAKVDDWVVTPRIGKPVEVQALWINALRIGEHLSAQFRDLRQRAEASFAERFWNEDTGCLHDVVDVDHQMGENDPRVRPNQIFAVGGLPSAVLAGPRARNVVDRVEAQLWTPLGLRTLSPDDPEYRPQYRGNLLARDGAYHQGTAWPWLLGAFVEAWLRVRGGSPEVAEIARDRFVVPLEEHLNEAGIGHVSEIADGDASDSPTGLRQVPRGCPFQAWSVSELLRLREITQGSAARNRSERLTRG